MVVRRDDDHAFRRRRLRGKDGARGCRQGSEDGQRSQTVSHLWSPNRGTRGPRRGPRRTRLPDATNDCPKGRPDDAEAPATIVRKIRFPVLYLDTPRQRSLGRLPVVVRGRLGKPVAAHLYISEIAVKIRRRKVMRKMGADSLVDPVRMADALSSPGAAACFEAPGTRSRI